MPIYDEKLKNVSVLGAAGKMGSGILLLTAMEMTDLFLRSGRKPGSYILNAIDISAESLSGLYDYLRDQIRKAAEKKIVTIRELYRGDPGLSENREIIEVYIEDVLKRIFFTSHIESSYDSHIIFEAVAEDPDLKVKLLHQIRKNNMHDPWFFTNTSSIPVSELDGNAGLDGKIIGFHFYNPPAVQKLAELITTKKSNEDQVAFAVQYARNLNKVIVSANDSPGFIGNGHFIRDLLFGIDMAGRLSENFSFPASVYTVNKITQDLLIRPMGIFQLMDYVGVDVCRQILNVMSSRLNDSYLHSDLIEQLIMLHVVGGQFPDGSQKPGLLNYEKGRPVSVFDPSEGIYVPVDSFRSDVESKLGKIPSSWKPWKEIISLKQKKGYFENYFRELKDSDSPGCRLAIEYHINSKMIGLDLVRSGVAANADDVNTVLLTGFFHAYGPVNNFLDDN